MTDNDGPLRGKVALVAGATRGAGRGIAIELGALGATVWCTGRTTREQRSEMERPETIEETAELVDAAGGTGIARQVDHLVPEQVRDLVAQIDERHGRLDILVNNAWGGDRYIGWRRPVWEHDLDGGLRMLRLGLESHAITSHFALALLIRRRGGLVVEMTDGTLDYNADHYRETYFLDVVKWAVLRLAFIQAHELKPYDATAVVVSPGWLRSESMLEDAFGVTEETWRDAIAQQPHFAISETPRFAGRAVAALAADPDRHRFNGQSLSSGQLAQIYELDDLDGSRPDGWRYMVEVADTDKPADTTGYR